MASLQDIFNKINELKVRTGLFSISKVEFFNLLTEILNKISESFDRINASSKSLIWNDPVETVADLTTTYPDAQQGWAALVTDAGYVYSFNGAVWKNTGLKNFPEISFDTSTKINSFNRGLVRKFAGVEAGTINGVGGVTTVQRYKDEENRIIGIRQSTNVVAVGYTYAFYRIASSYSDVSNKKIRFVFRANKPCSFSFRLSNGEVAWGGGSSANGTLVGMILDKVLNFTESNSLTQIVELNMSDYLSFYDDADRANMQNVTGILTANESAVTEIGSYIIDWFCLDKDSDSEDDVSSVYVNDYLRMTNFKKEASLVFNEITFKPLLFDSMVVRGGALCSKEQINSSTVRFTKTLGAPDDYVVGLYLRIDYSTISELNRLFYLNLNKNNGSSFNQFYVVCEPSDWHPGNNPIPMGDIILQSGRFSFNLHDIISDKGLTAVYEGRNYLYILLASYGSLDTVALDYNIQAFFEKDDIVNIATNISTAAKDDIVANLQQQIAVNFDLPYNDKIVAWGDSLTAIGGWTNRLAELTGMSVYNAGTGGESSATIMARQGGDSMIVNDIVIPSSTTPVLIARWNVDGGISTKFGKLALPLLQGGTHVNPCYIGATKGVLAWTGSNYADITGTWTFTRSSVGDEVVINRPTALRTDFDINHNNPYLMIIFMGQNGGYIDVDELVWQHKQMMAHANSKHVIVIGLSSGTASERADYEAAMRKEFGRYFISLREYLAHPVYNSEGNINSCYGLVDAGLTATTTDLEFIAVGKVPPQLLADTVHYTEATRTVIGNMIYRYCVDLNIF